MAELLTVATIAAYAADKLIGSYISKGFEKFVTDPLKREFFSKETLSSRLQIVIEETCEEMICLYGGGTDGNGQFPFYQSQLVLTELLKFRLFGKFDKKNIEAKIKIHENISPPTSEQLNRFFRIFEKKVISDEKLPKLEIDVAYKNKIFEIEHLLQILPFTINGQIQEALRQNHPELKEEYKEQLKLIESDVKQFRFKSAITHLDALSVRVASRNDRSLNNILAKLHFLKSVCYRELRVPAKKREHYIKAYSKDLGNLEYKALAATGYCEDGLTEKGVELAEEVLSVDLYNSRAWIILLKFGKRDLEKLRNEIPKSVWENQDFKTLYAVYFFFDNRNEESWDNILQIFKSDLESSDLPDEINPDNINYWRTVLSLRFQIFNFNNSFQYTFDLPKNYKEDENLILAYEISERILHVVGDTEIVSLDKTLIFINKRIYYLIEGTKNAALSLYSYYQDSQLPSDLAIPVIFALTQTGSFKLALKFIDQIDCANPLAYQLATQVCWNLEDDKAARYYSNLFFSKVPEINPLVVEFTIAHLDLYCDSREEKERFVSTLSSRGVEIDEVSGDVINLYIRAKYDNDKRDVVEALDALAGRIDDGASQSLHPLISGLYSILKEYKKGNQLLEPLIDPNILSRPLQKYIENLYDSKEFDVTLKYLQKYRKHAVEERFLMWEIEILQLIPDWQGVEGVAEVGKNNFPDNLNFITFYIIALEHQNKTKQLSRYLPSINQTEFPQDHAFRVAGTCFRSKKYDLGIRLLYPFANDPKNIPAREKYAFTLGAHLPRDYFEKIEEVREESTVIVQIDGEKEFFQITSEAIDANLRIRELLGKKVGDKFFSEVRKFGPSEKVEIMGIFPQEEGLIYEIFDEVDQDLMRGIKPWQ